VAGGRLVTPGAQRPAPPEANPLDQPRGFDLLRLPGVRPFLRWRYARLVFQLPLLLLAAVAVVDGLTGQQSAARNVATASVWLHYRGLVAVALAVFGNAFCGACPLMLTRGLTRRAERWLPRKLAWPRRLRGKWLVIASTAAFLWAYEAFDLWASPWSTAWLVIAYFVAAFAVDTLFPAGTFCRRVCPLGNFNFAFASVSPTQIAAVDGDVCRRCVHKPCLYGRTTAPLRAGTPRESGRRSDPVPFVPLSEVLHPNGRGTFPGCETGLYVPAVISNLDCTLCMNCVRACPYDNVALRLRAPGGELARAPWLRRGGATALVLGVLLAFWGVLNAAAMTAPFHAVAAATAAVLGTASEAATLAVLYTLLSAAGLGLTVGVATLADVLGGAPARPWRAFQRWGYVVVALGFGVWAAHYLFHFLTGAAAAIPVAEHFFSARGLGSPPDWRLAQLVPSRWLFPVQALVTAAYAGLALMTSVRTGLRAFGRNGAIAMWPMFGFVLAFTAMLVLLWAQPMQMRDTMLGPMR